MKYRNGEIYFWRHIKMAVSGELLWEIKKEMALNIRWKKEYRQFSIIIQKYRFWRNSAEFVFKFICLSSVHKVPKQPTPKKAKHTSREVGSLGGKVNREEFVASFI